MNKPILLLLTDEFPPNIRGGIASWCRNFSISLASNGYKIHIFLPKKNHNSELQSFHHDVSFTFVKGHDWNKFRWLYMMIAIAKWFLHNHNGIIIGTTWQHVSGLVFIKKMLKTKIICFAHGNPYFCFIYIPAGRPHPDETWAGRRFAFHCHCKKGFRARSTQVETIYQIY